MALGFVNSFRFLWCVLQSDSNDALPLELVPSRESRRFAMPPNKHPDHDQHPDPLHMCKSRRFYFRYESHAQITYSWGFRPSCFKAIRWCSIGRCWCGEAKR